MGENDQEKISIEKLVEIFGKLKARRVGWEEADYSRWKQSEAEYQQEQAEWLESLKHKKEEKDNK